ncbi:MAG: MATE family efflux transporter [Candidatus Aenigmarchaeota archaeon]|nr:MATE family efflux transporter [Candidatus Aenigmarchaeota archaeon]
MRVGRKCEDRGDIPSPGKNRDLVGSPIMKTLFILAAPIILGMAMQTGFNLIDTFFIGMLGSEELAAIGVTFPVVFIFIAIASGLTVGSTALISQAIGAGKSRRANNIAEHSLVIATAVGVCTAVLGVLFSPPLFSYMGVSGHILDMTIQYSNLIFLGFVFLFIGFVSQGIIQAGGDTVTPTRNLFISIVINVILDPVFIFGIGPFPAMGLVGAGVATVFARLVGAMLNVWHVFAGKALVKIDPKCFRPDSSIFLRIVSIGLPSSISLSMNSVGMILLMGLVGTFGTAAIAAFGVGMRLESLAILPVIGLVNALIPFIGQNLGAGRQDRARRATTLSCYAVILFMLVFTAMWFFVPRLIFSPFTSDAAILDIGEGYFRIISFGYVFLGLSFILGAAFQAAGRTGLQLWVNGLRWALAIGIAYSLVSGFGLDGVWAGFPLGNFFAFLVAFVVLKSGYWLHGWEEKKDHERSER